LQPSGPGGNQTVFQPGSRSAFRPDGNWTTIQPGTQSAFKPGINQTALQSSNLAAFKLHSHTAFQHGSFTAFKPGIVKHPSSPTLQSLDHRHLRTGQRSVSELSPVPAAPPSRFHPEHWTNQPCKKDLLTMSVVSTLIHHTRLARRWCSITLQWCHLPNFDKGMP